MRVRTVALVALLAIAGGVLPPTQAVQPTTPALEPASGDPVVLFNTSSLVWRIKRRLGLYMGIGIKVPFRMKARWYFQRYGVARALLGVPLAVLGLPTLAGFVLPMPKTGIWAGGLPREWCVVNCKVKTVTNLRSGVFVERDTTNNEIKACGAGSTVVAGVLTERNWTQPTLDPTTAPTAADLVEVLMQIPGVIARVRNGANLTYGAAINTSATGRAAAAAVAAAGDITKVCGKLLADSDGSGAETDALVALGF